ncbi:alpha/beta fold hydrolase [Bradyrhizobium neotropicale]|uniref:alpha/beta fold hydrolase n=1 Tax=Bradyrhizobium neotropicale TaxID=1497615 RepID=UPI001AD6FA41|nr:alpha/beta hydrolase [Bradyrhizobium neotropicale]MBO4225300.1 alpha/beta fold hydrolase [Bradyrhizobium neotropicale]
MPYVESSGIKLYFEEYGRGDPIIFVHEFESDLRSWEAQFRHFSRAYRCIAFNARGYPPSEVPDDPAAYGWELSVRDIEAVISGLSISRAHLIGSSMGAYAALLFGLRHPEKIDAIVAAGAGSGSLPSHRETWLKKTPVLARALAARSMESMAERMANHSTRIQLKYKDPKAWREFVERLKGHSARGMSNTLSRCLAVRPSLHDFRDQFSQMTIPVLLAVGDEDEPCVQTNVMLKSTIPTAGLWMCPNTGHAINLEEPAAFNAEAERFLSAVARGSWPHRAPANEITAIRKETRTAELRCGGAPL